MLKDQVQEVEDLVVPHIKWRKYPRQKLYLKKTKWLTNSNISKDVQDRRVEGKPLQILKIRYLEIIMPRLMLEVLQQDQVGVHF